MERVPAMLGVGCASALALAVHEHQAVPPSNTWSDRKVFQAIKVLAIGTSMDMPNATCITTKQVGNTSGDSKLATSMTGEINNLNVAMGSALDTMGNSAYSGTNITGGTEQRMQSAVPVHAGL